MFRRLNRAGRAKGVTFSPCGGCTHASCCQQVTRCRLSTDAGAPFNVVTSVCLGACGGLGREKVLAADTLRISTWSMICTMVSRAKNAVGTITFVGHRAESRAAHLHGSSAAVPRLWVALRLNTSSPLPCPSAMWAAQLH